MPPPQRYQHYNDVDVHVHVHRRHDSPPLPPKPNPKILPILLKVIIMTLITSMFFLLLGLVAFLLLPILFTSLNRHHDRHRGACHSDGLSPKELKSLSQFKVSKRNESQPGFESECVVCLEGFKQGQWCRKLVGCGHVFHRRCLDTWLLKVAACPTCRTPTTFDRFLGSPAQYVLSSAPAKRILENPVMRVGQCSRRPQYVRRAFDVSSGGCIRPR